MASIRKRGNSYLIVVSMGYTPDGRRRNPQQKTIKPPAGLTPKQTEKWLQEQAMLFELSCKKLNPDIDRFKPYLGSYKLVDLRPEHFRSLYAKLREQKNKATGKPLSEATVEGVHSLRHTAASLFIASGTDVGTVAGLLGHSQPSTTLDIYTHAFDKNKKATSQIMQNTLEI